MRRFSILLALLLALARPPAAEPVFPPGSSIGLEPPPGFTPSSSFSGFEDARTRSSLLLAELPPSPSPRSGSAFPPACWPPRG